VVVILVVVVAVVIAVVVADDEIVVVVIVAREPPLVVVPIGLLVRLGVIVPLVVIGGLEQRRRRVDTRADEVPQ
jgi:hypothetical protein